ncbi:MAG: PucR family transcriptional regulator ligand-binding domain-containing protein [Actinobacteria bacterium]|nr:PucR family transcriptional regulator ligand-binding domain-containing protein [Actinomycetota bacterium]
MLPTVAEVLALDVMRRGEPRVVAGADRLGTLVRWVHAIELADAARLLRGGELVLTTGIALPDEGALLDAYVAGLASVGVAGLAVELGRRYTGGLPASFVAAAESHQLPLIVFGREVPFVEITEAVHTRIIDDQLDQLRASARLHEVFTDLAVAGAGPGEILRQAALLAGRPVILEDLSHHVLACEPAGADPAALLDGFEARSRAVVLAGRTGYDEPSGWLVTMAGARGEDWGRVILACGAPPAPGDLVLIERTATALALARLLTRQHESLERQAHTSLIGAIVAGAYPDLDEAAARARALGVQVTGRQLLTIVIAFRHGGQGLPAHAAAAKVADALAGACRGERIPALVGTLGEESVGALLSLDRNAPGDPALGAVCAGTRRRLPGDDLVIGAGSPAATLADVRRSLLEAQQVAGAAAQSSAPGRSRPYYRLADLRLRGLLHLLGDDTRLATFVDRELGQLIAHDLAHGTGLTKVLGAYLAEGGNKAAAAGRAHLARPTFYERLRLIERILGVSLDSAESRTSLHVALLADTARHDPART